MPKEKWDRFKFFRNHQYYYFPFLGFPFYYFASYLFCFSFQWFLLFWSCRSKHIKRNKIRLLFHQQLVCVWHGHCLQLVHVLKLQEKFYRYNFARKLFGMEFNCINFCFCEWLKENTIIYNTIRTIYGSISSWDRENGRFYPIQFSINCRNYKYSILDKSTSSCLLSRY